MIREKRALLIRLGYLATLLVVIFSPFFEQPAFAGQVTSRSLTLSTSLAGATASHAFAFTLASSTTVGSIKFLYCTTASGTCTTPTGLVTTSATLSAQTGATGFSINNSTGGAPYITRSASAASGAVSYTLGSITNPTTTNQTFFVRISTYASIDTTGGTTDSGTVASSTANQITVTASVDETLTFCTGTSGVTSSSCAGATGSSVALGTITTSSTGSGTSQIGVSTNAGSGYAITVAGNTLTSGSNTITALASQTASTQGNSQFGLNLKANTTPSVGSDPAGSGTANPTASYNTANQYRFVSGDQVVTNGAADNFRLFTVSYIANIAGATPAGSYTTTLTYVATATF
ncbi:MAG TPA: hypothetical protein VNG90_00480 [Candidatus Acidoferrum sp.]|nr:hypothetical protein [Candidatus Acidoferrum sp.]